ncbi:MAG: pilus assembly protein [Deltaproteobacteria bacterium]|nr:pilus assembly protein [Deltaproteobacteria bacterium]
MKGKRDIPAHQRGGAIAEFAVVVPLLVAFLFAIVEFGLAFYAKGLLTNAGREGARFGVVYTTPRKTAAEIQAKVNEYLTKSGFTETAGITVSGAGGDTGSPLTVIVSYPYSFQVLPPFVQGLVGTVNLTAETVMRME